MNVQEAAQKLVTDAVKLAGYIVRRNPDKPQYLAVSNGETGVDTIIKFEPDSVSVYVTGMVCYDWDGDKWSFAFDSITNRPIRTFHYCDPVFVDGIIKTIDGLITKKPSPPPRKGSFIGQRVIIV